MSTEREKMFLTEHRRLHAVRAGGSDPHPASSNGRGTAPDARVRKPVTIGADVWIGGGALILPGVSTGGRTVVGAGSVVTRDLPGDVFAAGNPCRVIRAIE